MPDGAPQTGQRVYRWGTPKNPQFAAGRSIAKNFGEEDGVWHPTDPKALAEIRDVLRVALALGKLTSPDAVMQALGLTPPEPKEGGA